jgi:hypothetical protein
MTVWFIDNGLRIERHPAQRLVALMISSVRMFAAPISDSLSISLLDTGTV